MMGLGVANPHHCRNGFFLHDQPNATFPRQSVNLRLNAETTCSKTTPNADSALLPTLATIPGQARRKTGRPAGPAL
jgi:hypothetical protein